MSYDGQDDIIDFDESPRPAKRQRTSKAGSKPSSKAESVKKKPGRPRKGAKSAAKARLSDSDEPIKPPRKRAIKRASEARSNSVSSGNGDASERATRKPSTKQRQGRRDPSPFSDMSEDAFDPAPRLKSVPRAISAISSDEDRPKQKKQKHPTYVPSGPELLLDRFVSQIPPDSSDPNSLRGPIWIQPRPAALPAVVKPAPPPPPLFNRPVPPKTTPPVLVSKSPNVNNVLQNRQGVEPHAKEQNLNPQVRPQEETRQQTPAPAINRPHYIRKEGSAQPTTRSTTPDGATPNRQTSANSSARDTFTPNTDLSNPGSSNLAARKTTRITPPNQTNDTRHEGSADADFEAHGSHNELGRVRKAPASAFPAARNGYTPAPRSRPVFSVPVSKAPSIPTAPVAVIDIADELEGLPSDAFSSSPEREIPTTNTSNKPPQRAPGLGGTGYRQMTLHGVLSDPKDAEQNKSKKVAKPVVEKNEKPTQHKLNEETLSTWIYPVNLGTVRDYQFNIVQNGLFHNLLVALPTGLGKTFIAATVMLNWYRWTKDAQIIFVAPTKPLVAQQIEACFHTVGIPRSDTAMLTGEVKTPMRKEAWETKRVFFMTPQTMANDLRSGACDPKRIVLVVVDEAHRATGNYAYVDVVRFLRRFNQSFRILALTATPGSKVETVQEVIDGLDIARTEIRTENSLDIRRYVHSRDTETFLFDFSEEQEMIMELFSKAVQPILDKLKSQNATWMNNPRKITAYGLNMAQRDWSKSEAGRNASYPVKTMVMTCFKVLSSLAHAVTMLKFHGIGPFFRKIAAFRREVDEADKSMKAARDIRNHENFNKMYNYLQAWINNPDFVGHPKLEHLRSVILNHFLDRGETGITNAPSGTRVMVFAQYRDSAEEIARVLKRNEPMIRPRVFVGQATAEGSAGMDQKTQLEAIEQFKAGKYNTLVATSIGEEGLDIGEVDLIICYDANASPIRMLQRMGRTGRKRAGKIVLLLMKEKEETDFAKSKDNYEKIQSLITDGAQFTYHDDRSPRILPKDIKPVVDKRVVEIPTENSQTDLPIPTKRVAKKKAPPKKFHMPDGVVTGFVKASRVRNKGSDAEISDSEGKEINRTKKGGKRKSMAWIKSTVSLPPPEPEGVQLPFLSDVLLNRMQERELERKYQYVTSTDEAAVVQAPEPEKNLSGFKYPGTTFLVSHGRYTSSIATMLSTMHDIDGIAIERFRENLHMDDITDAASADHLYGDPKQDDLPSPASEPSDADTEIDTLDFPVPAPVPAKKRGRPAKPKDPTAARPPRKKAAPKVKAAPKSAPAKKAGPAPRGRKRLERNSSAMEAASSSPPPTPDDMRLPSQGIALGEDDTSGDDEPDPTGAWKDDSELDGFVVGSEEEIEFVSSSLPHISGDKTPGTKKGGKGKKDASKGKGKGRGLIRGTGNGKGKNAEMPGKKQLSEEFVIESDEDEVMDAEDESDDSIGIGGMRRGFDPGLDEGISAGHGRAVAGKKRRVVESDSDDE
ncbi:hypothetical protein B9Z65_613 [Elsinoe australis]|uniref:ATP-dependent DNA helicase n=1 Tax=Elsinoe australis TaxID=40998 RepID=A0A2P8AJ10_9PEZI|nr:hypothetical protein B9Z65_613 [Elsinoe australis]